MKKYLVTGGSGFIGSHFIIQEITKGNSVINLDILTYAANQNNLEGVSQNSLYKFVQGDIANSDLVGQLMREYRFDAVVNFAAESHVDNSISGPEVFYQTNVIGTFRLLDEARKYWEENGRSSGFRFLHVSTDEVFGDLPLEGNAKFSEITPYKPSSPYSSSKAASDHIAHAWFRTYGLPVIITNCSNNYGPHQHNEKLIPTVIRCAQAGMKLPVYGTGENVRDWIFVKDHCRGIALALEKGEVGESYCFGGNSERRNIDVVNLICQYLDEMKPRPDNKSYGEQVTFVPDRKGHDLRYAIDDSKARLKLGYATDVVFETHLRNTVKWYLGNA